MRISIFFLFRYPTLSDFWLNTPLFSKHHFLIFEKPDSDLGSQTILDLHNFRDTYIRRVLSSNNHLIASMNIQTYPAMVYLHPSGANLKINLQEASRRHLTKTIQEIISPSTNLIKRQVPEEGTNLTNPALMDKVYLEDLEAIIRFSVYRSLDLGIGMFEGDRFTAINNFVEFLANYLPLPNNGTKFLQAVNQKLSQHSTLVPREYKRLLNSTEREYAPVYSSSVPLKWKGCESTEKLRRGIECGFWVLFHSLTVNYAIAEPENSKKDPARALEVMRDYVREFFALCPECKDRFHKMVETNKMSEVKDRDEAILWLWKAHNEINALLARDTWNYDPMFLKIQYPSGDNCPTCRHVSGEWNEQEVLKYLKKKYGSEKFAVGKASDLGSDVAG